MKSVINEVQPYNGRLSSKEVVALQGLCFENAEALIEDAKLLNKDGRYARAIALSTLSFEELGKIILLGGALLYKTDEEWTSFWRSFRHHESKRKIVATIEADMWGLTEDERQDELRTEKFVEKMKLLCLYVDVVGKGKISTPLGSFGDQKTIASDTIGFAEGRAEMVRRVLEVLPDLRIKLASGLQEIMQESLTLESLDPVRVQKKIKELAEGLAKK